MNFVLIDRDVCKRDFNSLKRAFEGIFENLKGEKAEQGFLDTFAELGREAMSGNPVCQDFMAYLYKKGYQKILPENYRLYMNWEILAAANGNCFAIEKLLIFLNYAIDEILLRDDFETLMEKNGIKLENYNYALGRLFSEGVVDEMKINPKELIKVQKAEKYSIIAMREFRAALDKAIPKVLAYLQS